MATPAHTLALLPDRYAICRLAADADVPGWAMRGRFCSITRTPDELSVVALEADLPAGAPRDPGWRCLRVEGTLPLSAIGVVASLAMPLFQAAVSLFVISTHDTDYLLVKDEAVEAAVQALARAGHTVQR